MPSSYTKKSASKKAAIAMQLADYTHAIDDAEYEARWDTVEAELEASQAKLMAIAAKYDDAVKVAFLSTDIMTSIPKLMAMKAALHAAGAEYKAITAEYGAILRDARASWHT